ncbi:Ady3p KNAG_0E02930 [Huiozyma naganishii CBS 8797]|uniref:Uncharacterized protein n=1 Tax=Huiozyma naganishii (strain ATCC MYA-139 / BCRC 22969 / CBS 8797 / KCTC 17520 / NBRC 10181 / NCYC 3082 / Yp74L-3) TaxID=1071383 RepID=J7RZC6_HUIN7|nr:hypothetical protein KNAG_0E02930 [Kazachstania naganishii CBS 8797]CCK70552.1 hypothetical protein KNAG_0E02930 [Kazachstania naganishii CBS 8797]
MASPSKGYCSSPVGPTPAKLLSRKELLSRMKQSLPKTVQEGEELDAEPDKTPCKAADVSTVTGDEYFSPLSSKILEKDTGPAVVLEDGGKDADLELTTAVEAPLEETHHCDACEAFIVEKANREDVLEVAMTKLARTRLEIQEAFQWYSQELQNLKSSFSSLTTVAAQTGKNYEAKERIIRRQFKQVVEKLQFEYNQFTEEKAKELSEKDMSLTQSTNLVKELSSKLNISQTEFERFKSQISRMSLFGTNIGDVLKSALESENVGNCILDPSFKKNNPNVSGFAYTPITEVVEKQCTETINSYKEILGATEKRWEKEKKHFEQGKERSWENERVRLTQSNASLETEVHRLEKELALQRDALSKTEKERDNNRTKLLETEAKLHASKEESFVKLLEVNDQLVKERHSVGLKFKNCQVELQEAERMLEQRNEYINELREAQKLQLATMTNVTTKYNLLEGDKDKSVLWEDLCSIQPEATEEYLQFERFDSLTYVELQNIVKKLVVMLMIPMDKVDKRLIMTGIALKYERNVYSYFANRLNYLLHKEKIPIKEYQQCAYQQFKCTGTLEGINHGLTDKLEELYNDIAEKI